MTGLTVEDCEADRRRDLTIDLEREACIFGRLVGPETLLTSMPKGGIITGRLSPYDNLGSDNVGHHDMFNVPPIAH